MKVQPAAFLRTTLPLGIDQIGALDTGRYHSIWLPDHMVSFWPDSIWTPEFTDLAIASPSPPPLSRKRARGENQRRLIKSALPFLWVTARH